MARVTRLLAALSRDASTLDGHVDGVEAMAARRRHRRDHATFVERADGAEGASRDAAAARRDDRAREGIPTVHADAEALARAPELDAADVRSKIFLGILRRDPRLDRVASYLDVVLGVQTCVEIVALTSTPSPRRLSTRRTG